MKIKNTEETVAQTKELIKEYIKDRNIYAVLINNVNYLHDEINNMKEIMKEVDNSIMYDEGYNNEYTEDDAKEMVHKGRISLKILPETHETILWLYDSQLIKLLNLINNKRNIGNDKYSAPYFEINGKLYLVEYHSGYELNMISMVTQKTIDDLNKKYQEVHGGGEYEEISLD